MNKLPDVMAFFCENYPHKDELSKARLTKMVYLADWRMALKSNQQITQLKWTFDRYGPYLPDVRATAELFPARFRISSTTNMYGSPKEVIGLTGGGEHFESLTAAEIKALEHVIYMTRDLTWAPFIKLVYSTYPIVTQPWHTPLDLVELARKYQRELLSLSK